MTTGEALPVEQTSADILADQIDRLKEILPEAVTEGKVDFEKLKATLGEIVDDSPERYSFRWAGKRDAVRLLQVRSRATLKPCPGESVNWETTKNIFIEGENLEGLKLLYKSYAGRVKMIYIDPPYNTGNDFIYPDNFADPLDTYLKLTGQKDAEGNLLMSNPETSGRYHSAWLSMMYPRLFVARQLLQEDGIILVSIDDHEFHNLRLVMNDLFGEESFMISFIWHRRQMADSRNQDKASTDHEYVVAYRNPKAALTGRGIDKSKYANPDNDPRGPWFSADLTGLATRERRPNLHYDVVNPETGQVYPPSPTRGWSCSKETFQRYIDNDQILWPSRPEGRPRLKKFLRDVTDFTTGFSSMLDVGYTTEGTREIQELFGEKVMQFPKPVSLIKALAKQCTSGEDTVLDFFAGSATTAQAVMELNREDGGHRRVILVQLQEPLQEPKTIGRKTVLRTIADIGKERIRRVIKKLEEEAKGKLDFKDRERPEDLGLRVFVLAESNYRQWRGVEGKGEEEYAKEMELFTDPLLPGWKPEDMVWEVALKEGHELSSSVEELKGVKGNRVWRVTDPDRGQSFLICLDDKLKDPTVRALKLGRGDMFVCRDAALSDEQAANLALQCKLKTI